jgi:predicted MPP superfamily phosphohydrolase
MNRRSFIKFAAASAGGAVIAGTLPMLAEPDSVRVNRYRLSVPRLPDAFEGFTIVHLTDLHYGFYIHLKLLRDIVELVNSIPHHITVCTGDYVSHRVSEVDAIWPVLYGLRAPEGVFSILGNHDYERCAARSVHWLKRSGQDLNYSIRKLERRGEALWLAGAGDFWWDHRSIDALLDPIPPEACSILLAHNPDSVDTFNRRSADLVIAGHTHGGQINLPYIGSPVVSVNNKNYTSGLCRSRRGLPVFISRGIGLTRVPLRVNCPPEIAVLELTRGTVGAT